ncbi:GIY-YIG nuclease family protein [Winogradskyella ouciana]|uniref:GIY-YIG nuclease family protein n=1 Tax=Winogradskyella ouciana TaxID=2608631 RepID=UPI003D2E8995
MYYFYIIYSERFDKFYSGSSQEPWKRLEKHKTTSLNTFTAKYRPWELKAVFEAGNTRGEAEQIERFVKRQKSRNLLEKLITPDFKPKGKLAQLVRVPHVRN